MKTVPRSPAELSQALLVIFPSLPPDFGATGESVFVDAGPTFRSVLREFAYFLSKDLDALPDRQLRRFGDMVGRCAAEGGEIEDAIRTCLVPQLAQSQVQRLSAFLPCAL